MATETPKRPYTHKDRLLAQKFVERYFPGEVAQFQAPIYDVRGIDPKTLETFGVYFFERAMPRADVLIIRPDEVIVAEVKTRAFPKDVATVEFYVDALKHDVVRESEIRGRRIVPYLVVGHEDTRIQALCEQKGIKYVYLPFPEV